LEPDDRVATAHRAAFHGFQQKAHGTAAGDLEERRDRRLKVGNQGGPDHLRLAPCITLGKGRCLRLALHEARRSVSWAQLASTMCCPLSACRSARSLMVTPISRSSNWVYWASWSPTIALLSAPRRRLLSSDARSVVGSTTSVTRKTSCSPGCSAVALPNASLGVRKIASSVRSVRGGLVEERLISLRVSTLRLSAAAASARALPPLTLSRNVAALVRRRFATSSSRQRASTWSLTSSSVRSRSGVIPDTSYQT